MKQIVAFLLCLLLTSTGFAAENITPRVAQRLLSILDRADENPAQALEDLKTYAESRSLNETDRGFIIRERAALLVRQDQYDIARQELQTLLADKDDSYVPSLRILLGQLLLMDNQSAAALPHLEIWAEQTAAPNPGELTLLGYAYLQEERFAEAASIFERIVDNTEIVRDQWIELLAYAYTRSGRSDDAIALLEEIINQQPFQARWWKQLSNVYLILEDIPPGTASIAIAGVVETLSFEETKRLAGLFSMLNMPADGARILESALTEKAEGASFEEQMLLGEMWILARELEQAIAALKQASTLTESGEPALKIGQLYLQWERYEEARDSLQLAIDIYGEETPDQVYYLLAIIEINLDNLSAASEALDRLDEEGDYREQGQNLNEFIQNQLTQQQL